MNLQIIPRSEVEQTLRANSQPELRLKPLHNSHFHGLEEIREALPEHTHTPPSAQPWILFDPFVDLIAQSQCLDPNDVHTITLPKQFLTMVEQYGTSGILLQSLSSSALEDLEETFPRTTNEGKLISELFTPSFSAGFKGFFVRISTCSLKDSFYRPNGTTSSKTTAGFGAVTEMQQIWQRISTSARAVEGVKVLDAAGLPVNLFLIPWNEEIKTQREYRVFCAPGGEQVAAVSQYRWFEPWMHCQRGEEDRVRMEERAQSILDGIIEIHRKLIAHPEVACSDMKENGFTFDVVERENGTVALLELNNFGAMSGCGSCLFHWVHDAEILYGADGKHKIEFRVLAK